MARSFHYHCFDQEKLTQLERTFFETTQSVISRIEGGNVSVGLQMLQRIAQALDSRVEVVLH